MDEAIVQPPSPPRALHPLHPLHPSPPSSPRARAAAKAAGEGSVGPDLRRFCELVGGDCGASTQPSAPSTQQSEPTRRPLPKATILRKPGATGRGPGGVCHV